MHLILNSKTTVFAFLVVPFLILSSHLVLSVNLVLVSNLYLLVAVSAVYLYSKFINTVRQVSHGHAFYVSLAKPELFIVGMLGLMLHSIILTNYFNLTTYRGIASMSLLLFFLYLMMKGARSSVNLFRGFALPSIWLWMKALYIFLGALVLLYMFTPYSAVRGRESRFLGWALSSTTFSVYLLWVFLIVGIFYNSQKNKFFHRFAVFITILAIYLSGTRSAIVVLIIILVSNLPILKRVISSNATALSLIFLLLVSSSVLLPSVFTLLDLFVERGGAGVSSFGTRNYFTLYLFERLYNSSTLELLFGHGIEYSSNLLGTRSYYMEGHALPHNDLLRNILDYGLIFATILSVTISRVCAKLGRLGFCIAIIYYFSYLHNMQNDHYNILLMFVSFSIAIYAERSQSRLEIE